MSDPNDKQKCGTCHGLTWVTVENSFYPRTKPCPSCAPRADGSAAEVKRWTPVPGGTEVVAASAFDAVVAERDMLSRMQKQACELAIQRASRVAELELERDALRVDYDILRKCYNGQNELGNRIIAERDAVVAENARLKERLRDFAGKGTEYASRVAELERALQPLASFPIEQHQHRSTSGAPLYGFNGWLLLPGHVYAARAAISKGSQPCP